MTKKKKIFLIIFSFFAIISIPIAAGVSYAIINKNSKTVKITFFKRDFSSGVLIKPTEMNFIKNNIFENNNELFYFNFKLDIQYAHLYHITELIKHQEKNFNFSKIQKFLNNTNINNINFYDLYYFLKLAKNWNIKINETELNNRIKRNWDSENNLFFLDKKNDPDNSKLSITNLWLNYFLEKNDKTYISLIKNKFETIINLVPIDKINGDSSILELGKYLLWSESLLKTNVSKNKNIDKLNKFYLLWKNEIIKILNDDVSDLNHIVWFFESTDFYFLKENKEIKQKIIKKINNLSDDDIKNLVSHGLNFFYVNKYLGFDNIDLGVLKKFSNLTKEFFMSQNSFKIKPDVKNTYYSLLIFDSFGENIKKDKISNFLTQHKVYLDYAVNQNNVNEWVKEILFHEKISKLISYEKTTEEKTKLTNKLNSMMLKDIDYETVFNILEIMKINDLFYIDKIFFAKSKEMIESFKSWPQDDKKQITVFINHIDKILNLNLIDENELVDSLDWIFKNSTQLDYFQKHIIYNFFYTLKNIRSYHIREKIKKMLLANKEKVMQPISEYGSSIFINGLLRFEYRKIESE